MARQAGDGDGQVRRYDAVAKEEEEGEEDVYVFLESVLRGDMLFAFCLDKATALPAREYSSAIAVHMDARGISGSLLPVPSRLAELSLAPSRG
jgi:hypothetical protein